MTPSDRSEEPGVLDDAGLRRAVAVLCTTEITSWGVLYYAFPVLSDAITADTGWSPTLTMGAFSVGLVVTGLAGVLAGRLLDRHGPRPVMTTGSLLAVPALALIALAPTRAVFLAGWVLAGVAMSAVLYTPAFTAVTRWGGSRALRGLTAVTLVAGLASTVFAPLTAVLEHALGWRGAYLVLMVVLAAVTVPLHAFGLPSTWVAHDHPRSRGGRASSSREFVVLAVLLALAAFATYAALVNLVNLLVGRGVALTAAAVALGLGGAGQVAGRLLYRPLAEHSTLLARTVATLLVLAAATAALALVDGPYVVLVLLSVAAGLARGIMTLLQATAVPDRWGTLGLGRHNGLLAAPAMVASAGAPFAAALLAGALGGLDGVFLGLAVLLCVAAVLVPATLPSRTPVA
ncbi:MFS transporter [Nocardioides taihuensis]|uniref:MFS transporter n=1 Tax=Nocardioides taihuensis TaxID=1835606 RepID=A0ABW0BE35_9ACTN